MRLTRPVTASDLKGLMIMHLVMTLFLGGLSTYGYWMAGRVERELMGEITIPSDTLRTSLHFLVSIAGVSAFTAVMIFLFLKRWRSGKGNEISNI